MQRRSALLKRAFDVLGASVALLMFSPVMLVVGIIVALTMGRPVLFTQKRPGLHEKPFYIYKFRSMKNAVDASGKPLSDAERLTRFGRIMRAASLDELPQLFNILRGDMSIVGPRPLLYDFFPYYTDTDMRRHAVKPGVTGLAQVNGRNNAAWEARLAMDVAYVEHGTLWLDLRIILQTIGIVLRREGVTTDGHATFLRLDDYRKSIGFKPIDRQVMDS